MENRVRPLGIWIWLGWQLCALGLGAFRVPIWAHYPIAGESLALAVMLVAQIAGASLLFPGLVENVPCLVISIAASWPMGLLAALLADARMRGLVWGEAYVSVWFLVLYFWKRVAPTQQLAAVVALITFGGPLLWYLRADFAGRMDGKIFGGPIANVLSQISPDLSMFSTWLPVLAAGLFAISISIAKNFSRPRRVPADTHPI